MHGPNPGFTISEGSANRRSWKCYRGRARVLLRRPLSCGRFAALGARQWRKKVRCSCKQIANRHLLQLVTPLSSAHVTPRCVAYSRRTALITTTLIIGYRSLPAARPPHLTIVARRFTAKAASRLRAVTILIRLPLVYGRPM